MSNPRTQPLVLPPDAVTVTDLNRRARLLLEQHFNRVSVRGELSNLSRPGSGHWYFTLKDSGAQVRCAMFASRNRSVRFNPTEGSEVTVRGRLTLYENRGDFQIIVDQMAPTGEGALRAAFEALQRRLGAEGLFATERKRPLPALPNRLAIISSATGAALQDVLNIVQRRYPSLDITLLPVSVQGAMAEPQILAAFERIDAIANRQPELAPDVVLLTRGGGSLEDLWAFNAESIARAIVACPAPVVSAIGHETDITIADFVADLRAPTPSAAAELITPDRAELIGRAANLFTRAQHTMVRIISDRNRVFNTTARRLTHPRRRLETRAQHIDMLAERLNNAQRRLLERKTLQVERPKAALRLLHPASLLRQYAIRVSGYGSSLNRSMAQRIAAREQSLAGVVRAMHGVSPLETLSRGYAILTDAAGSEVLARSGSAAPTIGKPITSVTQVNPGDAVVVHLRDGQVITEVKEVTPT